MELDQTSIYQDYQKPDEDYYIDPEKFYNIPIDKLKNIPLRKLLPKEFFKELDPNFRMFCKSIKKNLREENYEIIAVTGYAGSGKSQYASIQGALIDENYCFGKNINFIPTANEVEKSYLGLKPYSYLQIDEASRSIHKHKWYEKTQQKLATIYDTEREGHFICSSLLMPRFSNFTENFRNFFIKYRINIICRGLAVVYIRDDDKDTKDPWNVDDTIKLKKKYWGNKRVFEKSVSDIIMMEQKTKNYLFYFKVPEIPKEIWSIYKLLKKESRIELKNTANSYEVDSYADKLEKVKMDRWKEIVKLRNDGIPVEEIAVIVGKSLLTIKHDFKQIAIHQKIKGFNPELDVKVFGRGDNNEANKSITDTNNISILPEKDKLNKIPDEFNKI